MQVTRVLAHKFLSAGAVGLYSGFSWPTPRGGEPGAWVEAQAGPLECGNGIHACRLADLVYWIDDELWAVELGGEVTEAEHGLAARRGRLLSRVETWNTATAAELARSSAEAARARARRVLAEAGMERPAAAVTEATSLEGALRALDSAGAEAGGFVGRVAGYAADVTRYALDAAVEGADWAACAAYVDGFLAGFVASRGTAKYPDQEAAYFEVRAEQARWLAARLALGNDL